MSLRSSAPLLFLVTLPAVACTSAWQAGPSVLADPRTVAIALGDPPGSARPSTSDLPHLDPPHHMRPCCAFGMDMQVDFAGMHVPFFEVGNVIAPDALGRHAYALPDATPDPESNGLVYTCRGGWIDTAHVQENADTFLFLALRMAERMRAGTVIEIPGQGATTTITVSPLPDALVTRRGALPLAAELAAWVTYRISIWHEVTTWFGYQSVAGFSEQPSAFSLEDLYSNALGIHLGNALLDENAFRTEEDYDELLTAFVEVALERLGAQPRETSRAIMASLDGRWWDSTRRLPDNRLVLRRHFPGDGDSIAPWRAESAFADGEVPEALVTACRGDTTRPLSLVTSVAGADPRTFVDIAWAPDDWSNESFPFEGDTHVVHERELDRLVADTRARMEVELGAGFDRPGPR